MKIGKIKLKPEQEAVLSRLVTGNILVGGVGSGKTYTAIAWVHQYHKRRQIIVITTAMNRNKGDWHRSLEDCGITDYIVDSWNNIEKYRDKQNCCFIFDAFAESSIVISGLPITITESKASIVLDDLLTDLQNGIVTDSFSQNDTIAKSMCKSLAVRTGT